MQAASPHELTVSNRSVILVWKVTWRWTFVYASMSVACGRTVELSQYCTGLTGDSSTQSV
jgi:hypothetical protein